MENKKIKSALVSVYHKQGLDELVKVLMAQGVVFYSTGGTAEYLANMGATVIEVADTTGYPSILGGRVKTLHPKVHGGILARRNNESDRAELEKYEIPTIDLVVVDLYPFEATVASGVSDADIIEKIDIGGIALIRGAAKNFEDVVIVPSQAHYSELTHILAEQNGQTTLAQRRHFAAAAFEVSSHYDTHIYHYFAGEHTQTLKLSLLNPTVLRYGENPHQSGYFYGDLNGLFEKLNGKELSYNNLVDIDGAVQLAEEFTEPFVAIIKHTNACGAAVGHDLLEAWKRALAGDPISAFGGVIACNQKVTEEVAKDMNQLFFEVLVAPDYTNEALEILKSKKNRIILRQKKHLHVPRMMKSTLNGYLVQDSDRANLTSEGLEVKTSLAPNATEIEDILFGDIMVKHLKSNAIALVKGKQLIGSGAGQTSRIDAIHQAIHKAQQFGFSTVGAVLSSDAFFPFADSVTIAHQHGINIIVEPGGSVKDDESINYCEDNGMCLVFTGTRHFKH